MTDCILWAGPLDKDGYGNAGGGKKAHVEAFKAAGGVIPSGHEIDHLCHVRACVEATHMEAVTHAVNMQRTLAALATHCRRGHEFSLENTIVKKAGNGRRKCRQCQRDNERRWHGEVKAARNARRRELYALKRAA